MTKYSNTAKKPGQYLKGLRERWKLRRKDKRGTAVNECWTPSAEASKADLAEFHAEELKLRRRRQLARQCNVALTASRSIADRPHKHEREIARRLRRPA